jgi:heptosyltransferase II
MSQTLFRILKLQDPDCIIDVFARKNLHQLLECMPEVDNCVTSSFGHGELKLFARFSVAKNLRKNSYTHAYILPNSFKSALIPFWAHIKQRIGWLGEYRYFLLNKIKPPLAKNILMVKSIASLGIDPNKQLSDILPLPKLQVSQYYLEKALERLKINLLQKKSILALCPGGAYGIAKRWPPKYFARIAEIKKRDGWDVWIFGGEEDKAIAQEIQKFSNFACLDLTGKTSLGETIALLSLATKVITNDSGLMHIAAALDRPLIAIYGATSPNFTPPLSSQAKIVSLHLPCSPCFERDCPQKHTKCLNDLYPELILEQFS